jgi:hypothetical protein
MPILLDETATCMIVGDDIFVMLLTQDKFKTFTPKEICDATKCTEVLVALSGESREKVDAIVRQAVAAGGTTYSDPQDHGFMYRPRVSGLGWSYLGNSLHGAKRHNAGLKMPMARCARRMRRPTWCRHGGTPSAELPGGGPSGRERAPAGP